MKQGKHQLRWQFNCLVHDPMKPVRFTLDNGDYDKNFVIESFEVLFCSMDRTTNNTSISGDVQMVVLGLTERGCIPHNQETVNNRPYAMRVADRRQIGWAMMDDHAPMGNVILDPHNIVGQDLWLNAWGYDAAKEPVPLQQDIGVLITLNLVKQSGSRALLQAVRDDPLN